MRENWIKFLYLEIIELGWMRCGNVIDEIGGDGISDDLKKLEKKKLNVVKF